MAVLKTYGGLISGWLGPDSPPNIGLTPYGRATLSTPQTVVNATDVVIQTDVANTSGGMTGYASRGIYGLAVPLDGIYAIKASIQVNPNPGGTGRSRFVVLKQYSVGATWYQEALVDDVINNAVLDAASTTLAVSAKVPLRVDDILYMTWLHSSGNDGTVAMTAQGTFLTACWRGPY
jgi:hypothetical protein